MSGQVLTAESGFMVLFFFYLPVHLNIFIIRLKFKILGGCRDSTEGVGDCLACS